MSSLRASIEAMQVVRGSARWLPKRGEQVMYGQEDGGPAFHEAANVIVRGGTEPSGCLKPMSLLMSPEITASHRKPFTVAFPSL